MAINTNSPSSNPQLAAILATTPTIAPTPRPATSQIVGGVDPMTGAAFTVPTTNPTTPPPAGQSGTGTLVVGGGSTPANGAQPAGPAAAPSVASLTTTIVPTTTTPITTPVTTTSTISGSGEAGATPTIEASGFGKAERSQPMNVSIDGATFGFPSFNESAKSTAAPAIAWGPGWTKVEKDGMWFMEHTNGMKAIPAVEYRVTPNPAEKVSTVKVANGWGKKFPDGTILVFDRKEGPYRLDPQGNKHKVEPGTHTFGGVKVRVFEASVVRTLDKNGAVNVFDSRGNRSEGSKRGRLAAALGSANAGASISGGGKTSSNPVTASGPSTESGGPSKGGGPGGKDGTLVSAGGAVTTAQMTQNVQRLTEVARGLVAQIQSGNVDGAKLADLQAQLNALPSGILQAAGAAGTITSDGRGLRHGGEDHAATPAAGAAATPATGATTPAPTAGSPSPSTTNGQPPTPPSSTTGVAGTGSPTGTTVGNPPASGTSGTNANSTTGGGASPVAGVDANATTKTLAAGAKAKVEGTIPTELQGKQARFAQLPDALQAAVAKAFGSDQGAAAFKADQLVAFNASGEVTLVEGGTVYTKHQAQIRGAGPGEEIALTVRPGRQPGSVGRTNATLSPRPTVQGGGATGTTKTSSSSSHSHTSKATPSVPTVAGVKVSGGGSTASNRITLFPTGGETRDVAFGGMNGSFTWTTLPATAKQAIMAQLSDPSTPAGKAFASRTGSGWTIDPGSIIVLDAGYASFMNGLALHRAATSRPTSQPSLPTIAGGGPSSNPIGHNATRPPVSGGGGVGAVRPGTPPPAPAVTGHSGMVGMPGMSH
ncbi:MAG: hypothetical protein JWL76_2207 [Thermoleophilia bacterium]|nr:hypothetical protein [Thermoleophilia bacterium]